MSHLNETVDCGDQVYGELLKVQDQQLRIWQTKLRDHVHAGLWRYCHNANKCGSATRFHIVPRGGDLTEFISNYPNNK